MDEQENGQNSGMRVLGELREPAETTNLSVFVTFVSSRARELGFSDKRVQEIEAAVKEALHNIIEHAFAKVTGHIHITCNVDHGERLVVVIVDDGRPFNMLLAGARFFDDADDRNVSTLMIKRMVNDIEYKRVENTNILILIASEHIRSKE